MVGWHVKEGVGESGDICVCMFVCLYLCIMMFCINGDETIFC